jgi:hypothetical protein
MQETLSNVDSTAQAEISTEVKAKAKVLKPAFTGGAANKGHTLVRSIISEIFRGVMSRHLDALGSDATATPLFNDALNELDAEEVGREIGERIAKVIAALKVVNNPAVTLEGGEVANRVAQGFVNYKPGKTVMDRTYAAACG